MKLIITNKTQLNQYRGKNLLRAWRAYKGIAQPQLAKMLGVSNAWVGRIETGDLRITPAKAIALETLTGINKKRWCSDLI